MPNLVDKSLPVPHISILRCGHRPKDDRNSIVATRTLTDD
jgi:hypothetical protein